MNHILFIDEDKATRDAVKITAKLNNLSIWVPDTPKEALRLLEKNSYQIVFCNTHLSHSYTQIIFNYIRSTDTHYLTRCILVSDKDNNYSLRTAIDFGAHDLLLKPFTGKELLQTLHVHREIYAKSEETFELYMHKQVFKLLNKNFNQELLTPIYAIMNVANMLENLEEDDMPVVKTELAHVIHAGTQRMTRNINNLLTYSYFMANNNLQSLPANTPINLSKTLKNILYQYECGKTAAPAIITSQIVDSGYWSGIQHFIEILFTELIDNAVKFSPPHGVPHVTLTAINQRFEFTVTNPIAKPVFIQTEELAPFKKFHKDTSRNGLGLGLYVAKLLCGYFSLSFEVKADNNLFSVIVCND